MHWKLSSKAKIASDFSNLLHIKQGNLRSGEFFLFRRGKKKILPRQKKKKVPWSQVTSKVKNKFRERLSEKMCTRQSRKVIWDMFNTLFLTLYLSNLLWLLSFSTHRRMSMISPAIFSNCFEKQWSQNPPQYLSGLSRARYPTTFLEIAVYCLCFNTVSFRGKKKLGPRPNRSPLGV